MPLSRSATSPRPSEASARRRLDQHLVVRGLVETRAKARDLIMRGEVRVDGGMATKPAQMVSDASDVTLTRGDKVYVSRGADKLIGGLSAFGFACEARVALDVGASTGGFTEVLIERGAARVYAVDSGRGQLHTRLRADPRVVSLEATDARALSLALVPDPVAAIVSDVSFISLTKALPAALALAAPGAWLIALIKPQFEAGPAHIGKGGIVRDPAVHDRVVADIRHWLGDTQGWSVTGVVPSPITGGDGNREFFIGASKGRS